MDDSTVDPETISPRLSPLDASFDDKAEQNNSAYGLICAIPQFTSNGILFPPSIPPISPTSYTRAP